MSDDDHRSPDRSRSTDTLAALVILLLGTAFRVWGSRHAQIAFDQTWFWDIALDIAEGKSFPAFGSLISGTDARVPSPLFHYLTALPQLLGTHPRWGAYFFCVLHGVAGLALFDIGRQTMSGRAGLTLVMLYAFNPWDVLYSHSIWLGNLLPVYGTLVVACSLRARDSGRAQGALATLLVIGPAIHLSLPMCGLFAATVLLLRPPQLIHRRALALGVALGALAFVPGLWSELQTGFQNTQAIFSKTVGVQSSAVAERSAAQVPVYAVLFGTAEMGYWYARGYWSGSFDALTAYLTPSGWGQIFGETGGTVVLFSLVVAAASWIFALKSAGQSLVHSLRTRTRPPDAVVVFAGLALCLIATAASMRVGRKLFYPHYISFVGPLCAWPIAWMIHATERMPRARYLSIAALLTIMLAMASNTIRYYQTVDSLHGLDTTIRVVDRLLEEDEPFELEFKDQDSRFVFEKIAERLRRRPLRLSSDAPVRFIVHDDSAWTKPTPEGGELLGWAPLLLERVVTSTAH